MKSLTETFYANVDPRRKQELADARMIQEDHNEIANLPRKEINGQFEPWKYPEYLDMFNQSTKKRI